AGFAGFAEIVALEATRPTKSNILKFEIIYSP
ncbi:MAG: hypothetical protein ACI89W_001680, partial [Gammaproteobacteria bacterium]